MLRPYLNRSNVVMLLNAGALVGTMGLNVVLGFVYWWTAARFFPPSVVGSASAAISAMALIATISLCGMGTLVIGEIQRRPHRTPALLTTALVLVGTVAACVALVYACITSLITTFAVLSTNVFTVMLLTIGAALSAVTLVLDQATIGLLRSDMQLVRNILFGTTKLVALLGVALWWTNMTEVAIIGTWVLGSALSIVLIMARLVTHLGQQNSLDWSFDWNMLHGLSKQAFEHHLLNIALQGISFALPIIVTVLLSPANTAYFYTASMIVGFVFVGPVSLTTVLYAVGADNPNALQQRARFTLASATLLGIAALLGVLMAAQPLLRVFGPLYAEAALVPVWLLSLGIFPTIISEHYVAVCRMRKNIRQALPTVVGGAALRLVFGIVGASGWGIVGLSIGVVVAGVIEAMFEWPVVWKVITEVKRVDLDAQATAHRWNDATSESVR